MWHVFSEIYKAAAKYSQLKYPDIYHLGQVDQEICCFNKKKKNKKQNKSQKIHLERVISTNTK